MERFQLYKYQHFELCVILLFLYARLQTGRNMAWWCPSVRLALRQFQHFSPTCFDIMSWHFVCDFLSMKYISSSSIVNLRQTWRNCAPFELRKLEIQSFLHFSPACFDMLSGNFVFDFVLWNTDQVRVSSLCVNLWRSYASFVTYNIGHTQFSAFISYMLWHFELKFACDFILMYYR